MGLTIRSLLISGIAGGLALSAFLFYQDYLAPREKMPHLAVFSPNKEVKPGDVVYCYVYMQIPKHSAKGDIIFEQEWPEGTGVTFVPGSLQAVEGNLHGAAIWPYGQTSRIRIEGIAPNQRNLKLKLAVRIPENKELAGSTLTPVSHLWIGGKEVETGKKVQVSFAVPGYRISQQVIRETEEGTEYQVIIANPAQGVSFAEDQQKLILHNEITGAMATIDPASIHLVSGRELGAIQVNGNSLEISDVALAPGEVVTLSFTAKPTQPLVHGEKMESKASLYLPHSYVQQSAVAKTYF